MNQNLRDGRDLKAEIGKPLGFLCRNRPLELAQSHRSELSRVEDQFFWIPNGVLSVTVSSLKIGNEIGK